MTKIANTLFATMLMAVATFTASAQPEETRQVSDFHSIASGGPFTVHVKINGTESLKIVAAAEDANKIETVVEDGTLKIKSKKHDSWNGEQYHDHIDIYVTAKSLSSASNAGSGDMTIEGAVSGSIVDIALAGSGSLSADVKAGSLHASLSGSGSIHLEGKADEAKVSVNGSGSFNSKELETESASISVAGSGNVYLAVNKSISGHIAGSGNIVYSGNATEEDIHTAGSGRINRD